MTIYILMCWEERFNEDEIIAGFRDFEDAYKRMVSMASHDNEVNNLRHNEAFFKYGEEENLESRLYIEERSALVDDDEGWKVKYWIKEMELQ